MSNELGIILAVLIAAWCIKVIMALVFVLVHRRWVLHVSCDLGPVVVCEGVGSSLDVSMRVMQQRGLVVVLVEESICSAPCSW